MSQSEAIQIHVIETPLLGQIGFAITVCDESNSRYGAGESFISVGDFFYARSFRVNNAQLATVGITVTASFLHSQALAQVKADFSEYLKSLPQDAIYSRLVSSATIVNTDVGALIQVRLRGKSEALERIYRQSATNAVRTLLGPVLELSPLRVTEL